ncbi:hypothetical protein [Ruegeria atlantica]|uniref:Uncharacterized protein n=1 Tax=Ruegeria atlantica TaxID=81569 RepID=A0A0P1E1Z9_9RHOB|nr:hypothetical protein [Ruegeria atlantica]CUH42062.1 hypothetical protein RUM4293_00947 [Ruegeria atlantica]
MSRLRRGRRAAPNSNKQAQSVKVDLEAAAMQAAVTVDSGEYDVEITDATLAVNDRKQTISLRLTPKLVDTGKLIRLQPLCVHDGNAHNLPWYIPRNAKLVRDILEAAGREPVKTLDDPSVFVGCRVGLELVETTDGRGMPVNELVDVYQLEEIEVDNVEPLKTAERDA